MKSYRQDIDGLRALAILGVVLYHAFPKKFPGGFIGVDIFFVISGYLITGLVLFELEQKTFRLTEFYRRRIRRLFPALLLVLLFCLAIGWGGLFATEYALLGQHILHGVAFTSNFLLLNEVNYFDEVAEAKPLLHLWSLAIEEQFYLIWPVLILIMVRRLLVAFLFFPTIILLSFLANIYLSAEAPAAAFYTPYARAWELFIGGAFAFYERSRHYNSPSIRLANLLGLAGTSLIIIGLMVARPTSGFPGWAVLFPAFGTLAIIAASPMALVNRVLLSRKTMVLLGLISYPLYLWHWPLLSFAYIFFSQTPPPLVRIGIVLVSLVLAWVTYFYVERPLRNKSGWKYPASFVAAMVLVGIAGYAIQQYEGVKTRNNAISAGLNGDLGHADFHREISENFLPCEPAYLRAGALRWGSHVRCAQSRPNMPPDLILLGDSHAEHLFIGFARALPEKNIAYYVQDGLPYLSSGRFENSFQAIREFGKNSKVILSIDWAGRLKDSSAQAASAQELSKTIDYLNRYTQGVVIVHGLPAFSFNPQKCKSDRWPFHGQENCNVDRKSALESLSKSTPLIHALHTANTKFDLVNLEGYLCGAQVCSMAIDNDLLFRDKTHLNILGSVYVANIILRDHPEVFQNLKRHNQSGESSRPPDKSTSPVPLK